MWLALKSKKSTLKTGSVRHAELKQHIGGLLVFEKEL